MISRLRFAKLKRGDVIVFNGTPRIVQEGPSDDPEVMKAVRGGKVNQLPGHKLYVRFSIRRRSWTNRAHTMYSWNDIKRNSYIPREKMSLRNLCEGEKDHLSSIGFDWKRELGREIEREKHFNKVTGRKPNRALKLAIKQHSEEIKCK